MTGICEVVITAPDADWLADFARRLVEDRLVADAHEIPTIKSIYRWQGEMITKREARVALHTRAGLVRHIIQRTVTEHPYDVPCIIALPTTAANPTYERWILDETAEASPR